MDLITQWLQALASFLWGLPLIFLLVGGGLYFAIISRFQPYRYFGHAIAILAGRYDKRDDPGDLSHLQALTSALSGTLGMGNIAGVALAQAKGRFGPERAIEAEIHRVAHWQQAVERRVEAKETVLRQRHRVAGITGDSGNGSERGRGGCGQSNLAERGSLELHWVFPFVAENIHPQGINNPCCLLI